MERKEERVRNTQHETTIMLVLDEDEVSDWETGGSKDSLTGQLLDQGTRNGTREEGDG